MYAKIRSIIAPILLISGLGYFWSLFKLAYHERFLTSFVMNIGMPSLILSAIIKTGLPAADLLQLTKITLLGLVLFFAFNAAFLKLYKKDFRTYIGPLSFTNTANMGIPVCMLALGDQAMVLAMVIFMVTSIVQFSLGVAIVGGRNPLHAMLTAPVFYATILAFLIVLLDWSVPATLVETLDILGATAIPLMLISLGVSLQSLQVKGLATSLVMSVVRIAGGFILGLLLCWLLDLQGLVHGVVLLQASMPSAVASYMLANMYDSQPQQVAGVVLVSTLVSFASLPLLLWFIL